MPHVLMAHHADPKDAIMASIPDLDDIDVYHNHVLIGIYRRPERTKSGIYLPDQHREEDVYQSKIGLVLKAGPLAFNDPTDKWMWGDLAVGDWVVFRPSDGWSVSLINDETGDKTLCRMVQDTSIKAKISKPDMVW